MREANYQQFGAYTFWRIPQDFPGGPVVKSLPANDGDTGSIPWCRKIPHALEQLIQCAATTEPVQPRAHASQ